MYFTKKTLYTFSICRTQIGLVRLSMLLFLVFFIYVLILFHSVTRCSLKIKQLDSRVLNFLYDCRWKLFFNGIEAVPPRDDG